MSMRHVLIIDDEESIRTAARFILEDVGYIVYEAANGQAGLDYLRTTTEPLVVLLDLMMPVMSGITLLQTLHQRPGLADGHTFILFTAASTFTADTLRLYLPDHQLLSLPKPFSMDELLAIVDEAAASQVAVSGHGEHSA